MSSRSLHKFSSLYEISSGISTTASQAGHGAPFLSFSTVFNNYFVPHQLDDMMDTTRDEQTKYSVEDGDVFLTRTSEVIDELGMSSVALKNYPTATYSGFLKRLRPIQTDKTYSKYMAFYLRSPLFRKTMTNNAVLTLRASLNEDIFSYLNLLLPEFDEQVRIGDFLYLLHAKIDCNNRINAELEAMAKTLYDYWFVQFEFPDKNGKPYKSSGGKMVYDEVLKRKIPVGWGASCILELFDVCYGYPFDSTLFTNSETSTPVVRIRDILSGYSDTYTTEQVEDKYILKKADLIIGMDGNFHMNFWSCGNALLNQRCVRVRKSKIHSTLHAYFSIYPFIKAREKNVSRTTVGHLSAKDIQSLFILTAPENIQTYFTSFCDTILAKICINNAENIELAKLRDWLLPMLMNGQATVADDVTETPILPIIKRTKSNYDQRFATWCENQALAARGSIDEATLRDIFDAMDDDDK